MRVRILIMFLFTGLLAQAQIKITKLDKTAIPKSVTYKGHVIDAVKFSDAEGEHLIITTETGETPSKNGEGDGYRDAALYAYHYLAQTSNYKLTWSVYDFVKDCPVDIRANFVRKSFAITDLDNNGKAEVWLMYRTICHGDVSPSNMKIIMYESNEKFAVRGTNEVQVSQTEHEGGKYTFNQAFNTAPATFRQYAKNLWKKNLLEKWD